MVKLYLNNEKYRYDVYHIFRLFYEFVDIKFVDNNYDYEVNINDYSISIKDNENNLREFNVENSKKIRYEIKKNIFIYLKEKLKKDLPWGILIGIRPTKIVLEMLNDGLGEDEIINILKDKYFVRKDKGMLCIDIAKKERERVNKDTNTVSIYVGMPFCPTTCLYCSFASTPIVKCKKVVKLYLESLSYEIDKIKEFIDRKDLNIECVYFGGGTPTSVNTEDFEKILKKTYESFVLGRDVKEFNVECGRPDSINEEKLKSMKRYNVNRISINPQTMNDDTLKSIGRHHTVKDVIDKFNLARSLGFDDINMDIIVGLPNENLNYIENTCREIEKLNPDSITVHGMSVKRASILHEEIVNKKVAIMKQDELNEMYDRTFKLSKDLKLKPYYMYRQKNMVGNMENVGYCKEGKEGLYNIEMIEDKQTIIALGADAVTKVVFLDENRIERFGNIKDVNEYIKRLDEKIEGKLELLETLY